MPELPEVETTIRYLRPALLGEVIRDLTVSNRGESHFNIPFSEVQERIIGTKTAALNRLGKWMLFEFLNPEENSELKAVGHLRMSGRYKIADEVIKHPHNRFQIHLENGRIINYIDQRRFGTFHFVEDFRKHKALAALGPDILAADFTAEQLYEGLRKTKKPLYSALLDQTVVAGLGNIYVNETLHAAGLHPLMPGLAITPPKAERLLREARRILTLALEMKGTTLIDNLYQDPEGKTGQFAKMLQVYGKKPDPDVEVLKIGGRSVFVHRHTKLTFSH